MDDVLHVKKRTVIRECANVKWFSAPFGCSEVCVPKFAIS